jgi:hypothetical protein
LLARAALRLIAGWRFIRLVAPKPNRGRPTNDIETEIAQNDLRSCARRGHSLNSHPYPFRTFPSQPFNRRAVLVMSFFAAKQVRAAPVNSER